MPTYVRQSAKLKCTMGSAQSALQLSHPVSPVLLCGSPMAGMADSKPMANIAPFGLCKSLANPTVSAATAAAGGKLQEMPCIPAVTSPWAYAKMNVFVKGQPAVMNDSRCVCMWLGIIKVADAGQKSVIDTALPPFIAAEPEPPAAATAAKTAGAGAPTPQTPKKGLFASIAAAVTTAIGGLFGRLGKGEEAEAKDSQDVTPVNEEAGTTETRGKTEDKKAAKDAARRKKEEEKAAKKDAKEEARRKKNEEKTAKKEAMEEARRKKSEEKAAKKARKKTAPESETPTEEAPSADTAPTTVPTKADGGNAQQSAVPMKKTAIMAKLIRYHFGEKRTFGTFELFCGDKSIFNCYTCEDTVRGEGNPDTVAKWKIAKESAIPYGRYICKFTYSDRFKRNMWLVDNVPGFSGIRIHRGKDENWTEGCLLLGESIIKNYTMLDNSVETVEKFEKRMAEYGNQNFVLEITKKSQLKVATSKESKPN